MKLNCEFTDMGTCLEFQFRTIRTLLLLASLLLAVSCRAPEQFRGMSDEEASEAEGLLELSTYVISDVMGEFYAVKQKGLYGAVELERIRKEIPWWPEENVSNIYIHDKVEEKGYGFLTQPMIDKKRGTYVQINPRTRNFISEIMCLVRETHEGKLYEYWIVKAWGESIPAVGIYFFVTVAESLDKPRIFLVADTRYIPEFKISDSYTMRFPESDLAVLYNLQAWRFPSAFPESDLEDSQVILTRNREYVATPFEPRNRPVLQQKLTPEEAKERLNLNEI